jgi:sec-independent protein translocase protein TatB
LLVLGPERLPKVARTAGALVRRARASWQNVRDEIERELAAEDLKRSINEAKQVAVDLRGDVEAAQAEIKSSSAEIEAAGKPPDGSVGENTADPTNTILPPGSHDERH